VFVIKSYNKLKNEFNNIIDFKSFSEEEDFLDDFYNKSIHMKEVIDLTGGLNQESIKCLVSYFNYYLKTKE
jgi:hypothetical protein